MNNSQEGKPNCIYFRCIPTKRKKSQEGKPNFSGLIYLRNFTELCFSRKRKEEKRDEDEEILWKKRILLGRRCRSLRSTGDGEIILYDEKGNMIEEMRRSIALP
ncbi:hypothetical protein AMTR_s00103p00078580 [Amborella trichopoda]|uniref:Uncharacterized protein n=1 Tax=Amborella trichopoda TaxID=13333 RepID=W1NZU5_AMBTC|nr:hypothetical protein AMTR_s00103p00078580 [Amborella trichopoda]